MTLDEARMCLAVEQGASATVIREAFRRRAREVHPDRHPDVDAATRAHLAREFDLAREACDILVQFTLQTHESTGTTPATAQTEHRKPASPPRPRERRRTSEQRPMRGPAPRVTMRFEEFVTWSDAAAFSGNSTVRPWIDWTRIIVWSSLGIVIAAFTGAIAFAYATLSA